VLKIDRTFVSSTAQAVSPIARAILDLGRTLGLQVIAEGIELADQARWLSELGCRFGQGYLFARPLGPAAIEARLGRGEGLARPASDVEPARDERPRRLRVVGED